MNIDIPTAITAAERGRLQDLAADNYVLEIGSLLGHSTVAMAQVASHVVSVDPHMGYPVDNPRPTLVPFLENLERYGVRDKVTVTVGTHRDVLPWLRSKRFDLIFIDCTGEYDLTHDAITSTFPCLAADGVVCVHDCGHPDWPGALAAVESLEVPFELVDRLAVIPSRDPGIAKGEMA